MFIVLCFIEMPYKFYGFDKIGKKLCSECIKLPVTATIDNW